MQKASEDTCKYAISLRHGGHNDGIIVEQVDMDTKQVKYRIHTDQNAFPYSWFEHYGTGQYAELEHIGTTKHFIESGYTEWFIPVAKVEQPLHYPIVEIQGVQFYIAHGVKANPFLQKAEFEKRGENLESVRSEILNLIKEVCK